MATQRPDSASDASARSSADELAANLPTIERALARLALLGFDHDPALDAPLSALRSAIRNEEGTAAVAGHAAEVETVMRRLGLPRESGQQTPTPADVLQALLDAVPLPRHLDLDARRLRQRLRQATRATPMDQLAAETGELLEQAMAAPPAPKGLRALFSGPPQPAPANPGRPLQLLLDELILPAHFHETQEAIQAQLEGADEEQAAQTADTLAAHLNDLLTGTPPATPELRRPLNRLVDILSEGEERTPPVVDLQGRIASGPRGAELPAILNDTADLAARRQESAEEERHDLEGFLQQLMDHLNDLGHRFQTTDSLREAAREQARAHDDSLHAQMDGLETDLEDNEDLNTLKQAIQGRLESVRERLEAQRRAEEERDRELEAEVTTLRSRLAEMENESATLRQRLHEEWVQAHTDPLTGLPNRLGYEERARELIDQRPSSGDPLSLAVLDIDYFKHLNDNFGHQAGDKALQIIANLLSRHLPAADAYLARYGGEELVCLLPGLDQQAAMAAVEHMRQRVREAVFTFQEQRLNITLSAGVTELGPADTAKSAFNRADSALLAAKEAGRDTSRKG
ncbi:MAG TPA: diguanylate cyclase [Gammaproteobacteria bacterium]|nr:diguanylate cyclase [Gammaproteobacteria bacterium]